MNSTILDHFPEDLVGGPVRPAQRDALLQIEDAYNGGIGTVFVEAPTGTGKTAIAQTVSAWMGSRKTFILTATGVLQDQYLREVKNSATYKGSTYFTCQLEDEEKTDQLVCKVRKYEEKITCKVGRLMNRERKEEDADDAGYCGGCCYVDQRNVAVASKVVVFNYMSYLVARRLFGTPELLVLDEAHKIESSLMEYLSVEMTTRYAERLGIKLSMGALHRLDIESAANKLLAAVRDALSKFGKRDGLSKEEAIRVEALESMNTRLDWLTQEPSKWVLQPHRTAHEGISFKPIFVDRFANNNLVCGRRIFMSATLSRSVTARALGVDVDNMVYVKVPSPFPVANRPIYGGFNLDMSMKSIEGSIPLVIECVRYILKIHENEKGVIHSGNYAVQKAIEEALGNGGGRLLYIGQDKDERSNNMKKHQISGFPTVLIGPGLVEGLDLKGDLGRFQVVCKLPFLSLGDLQVEARRRQDGDWYIHQAAAALVQASGRCVRTLDDHAITYVLDRAIAWVSKSRDNRGDPLVPTWYSEAIQLHSTGLPAQAA